MAEAFLCPWCARWRRTWSGWEQKTLSTGEYKRMCSVCANRRLRNPYNALLPMRKVTTGD